MVNAITSATITDSLERKERAILVGFGNFEVRQRKARKGVNPQTKEAVDIPARSMVRFRAGGKLREKVV